MQESIQEWTWFSMAASANWNTTSLLRREPIAKAIALNIDGAGQMRINAHGDLVLSVVGGEVKLLKPVVYQNVKGERRKIAGRYAIGGDHRVTFAVGAYNRNEPLILDPVLNYSTYLGRKWHREQSAFRWDRCR